MRNGARIGVVLGRIYLIDCIVVAAYELGLVEFDAWIPGGQSLLMG